MATQQAITATAAPPKWIVAEDPAQARTPTLYNGYVHPGPYTDTKAQTPILAPRQEPDPTACDCSACLIYGPKYCKAHVTHISDFYPVPTPAEEAAEIVAAAERRAYREQLITEQAGQAAKAGHCPTRIAKAVAITHNPAELALAAARYFSTTSQCRCPDAIHGHGRTCKHQIAAIISANVERRIEAQAQPETKPQPAEILTPEPSLERSPFERMIARRAQERIERQAQEKEQEQAAHPSDALPVFERELTRSADGMIWA